MSQSSRQMLIGVMAALLTSILILSFTFMTFPLNSWSDLWEIHLFDLPYLLVVILGAITAGMLSGLFYSVFWLGKIRQIDHQLDQLLKGQKLEWNQVESSKELATIQDHIQELHAKMIKQAELSQRLATERAQEREKSLQEVVVQERNRLARDLHDSVSQQLFAASMMMSAINESRVPGDSGLKKQLGLVENMIHQSQLEMRALLLHLRPVALKGKTLQEGMEELLKELRQKVPMDIEWKIEAFQLDKGIEDHLFRILQESVSNTLRHAKAHALHVMLIQRDEYTILRVTDDGVGFNIEESKTSSYGLLNMQERALEVGGHFKVVSLINQGTRIEVKVPLIKQREERND